MTTTAFAADPTPPSISPSKFEAVVFPGDTVMVAKTVVTPEIPPKVDVCLLQDETGSFIDDIANLQNPTTIAAIFDGVRAGAPDSQFAVAGFRDYPVAPFGEPSDWVYRLYSSMSPDFAVWSSGVNSLSAGGGWDTPEAQYDAIVASVNGGFTYANCGWRADPAVTKVLVVTTDAPFHLPDGTHVNDAATTLAVLDAAGVVVVGLKAPGAGGELDYLASMTGGSVQPLGSDGANIAAAILAGLQAVEVDVSMASTCEWPISTKFMPAVATAPSGDPVFFDETITVDPMAPGGTYVCRDYALINGEPMVDAKGAVIYETKTIKVPEGYLTGGGQILKDSAGVSFGGNVGFLADFSIVGQWHVSDPARKLQMHSTSFTSLQFYMVPGEGPYPPDANANAALFDGTARVKVGNAKWMEGCTFTALAEDRGEPAFDGQPDTFGIGIVCGGSVYTYGWAPLDTGNLQIHSGVKY